MGLRRRSRSRRSIGRCGCKAGMCPCENQGACHCGPRCRCSM